MKITVSSATSNTEYLCKAMTSFYIWRTLQPITQQNVEVNNDCIYIHIYIFKYDSIPTSINELKLGTESASGLLNVMQLLFLHDTNRR